MDVVSDVVVVQGIVLPQTVDAIVMVVERRVDRLMVMGQERRVPNILMIDQVLLSLVMQSLILQSIVS